MNKEEIHDRWGKNDPLNSGALHKAMEDNKAILYVRAGGENYYWVPELALQERLNQAKLDRTKEILEMLPKEREANEKDVFGHHRACVYGFNYCLSLIKELLTKPNE